MNSHSLLMVVVGACIGGVITLFLTSTSPVVTTEPSESPTTQVSHRVSQQLALDDMLVGLENKTGDEFDRAFIREMILHHQGAVLMANVAMEEATREEIKKLAAEIVSSQTAEIELMNQWQKTWFPKDIP